MVFVSLLAVAACGQLPVPRYVTPFEDQPDNRVLFTLAVVDLDGTVWSFERDGTAVNFGGPIGLIFKEKNVRVVSAAYPGLSLETGGDARKADPVEMAALINAAHRYCDLTYGHQNHKFGAAIYADGERVLFLDHCQETRR